jgi:phospholipid/cholesterol/gamma-HCH transport system substrate-binding protein
VELSQLADNMEDTFKDVNAWIQKYGDDMGQTIKSAGSMLDHADILLQKIDQENLIGELKVAVNNASTLMDKANQAIDQLQEEGVFTNIGTVMANMKSATESIDTISQDLANGQGTLGRLLKGDDLYLRFTAVMSKIDTLMNDVNHYGVLFHLNKNWQRQRTKQITALNALNTPQGFRDYYEKEIDQINTSMARLSMLLEKAQDENQKACILESEAFKKDFAELMRLTDELSDNLKLYNQQLLNAPTGTSCCP